MRFNIISPDVGNGTDGLASAYQLTELTGAGYGIIQDTAGSFAMSVVSFPSWTPVPIPNSATGEQHLPDILPEEDIVTAMAQDPVFKALTMRGLEELDRGRYSKLEEVKRRLGDI